MRFWGSWSIFGVYFVNFIGALWFDFYVGFFIAIISLIFGINPLTLITLAYEAIPSMKKALVYKLVGLIVNIVIGIVYYGGFKRFVTYKDELNLATEDTVELRESGNNFVTDLLITF